MTTELSNVNPFGPVEISQAELLATIGRLTVENSVQQSQLQAAERLVRQLRMEIAELRRPPGEVLVDAEASAEVA